MQYYIFTKMPLYTHVNKELKYPSISVLSRNMSLSGTIETHKRLLAPLESDFKVDSIFLYKASIAL